MVRIRIEKAALPRLVLPSVSIRDGSPDPEHAPLFCPDPLPWRSTTVMVPADRRAAANLRRLPRLIVAFYATLTVFLAVQLFGLLVNPDWAVGAAMVLPGIFVAVLVGTALRWSQLQKLLGRIKGRSWRGRVHVNGVHPQAALEWVEANPPGAVVVTDWQGAWIRPPA